MKIEIQLRHISHFKALMWNFKAEYTFMITESFKKNPAADIFADNFVAEYHLKGYIFLVTKSR